MCNGTGECGERLAGEDDPVDSRSVVIRHLINEYDPDKTAAGSESESELTDSPTEPTGSYVSLDAHRLVRESAGAFTRLK